MNYARRKVDGQNLLYFTFGAPAIFIGAGSVFIRGDPVKNYLLPALMACVLLLCWLALQGRLLAWDSEQTIVRQGGLRWIVGWDPGVRVPHAALHYVGGEALRDLSDPSVLQPFGVINLHTSADLSTPTATINAEYFMDLSVQEWLTAIDRARPGVLSEPLRDVVHNIDWRDRTPI
jgi:hypothetical protein